MPLLLRKPEHMRFQIMSDLHLEMGKQYTDFHIQPCAPYLILAGDIGRLADYGSFRDFLKIQCTNFQKVFLILGNHEFFGSHRTQGLILAERLENDDSLRDILCVMNRRRIDLPRITILGCTLHSHVPDHAMSIVSHKINDFRRSGGWTVADHTAEHAKDVEWLTGEIESIRQGEDASQRKILVITHHAPAIRGTSAPANESNAWSSAFSTDLLGQCDATPLDNVQCWVFGHTHHCSEFMRGKVRLVSNQRGYDIPKATRRESTTVTSWRIKMRRLVDYKKKTNVAFDPKKVIRL